MGNISKPKAKPEPVKEVPIPIVEKKDRDGDGVVDSLDACPDVAGLPQFNGCPDTDGDGIPDKDDKCPNVKGIAKYQGCPILDTDCDGINDEEDVCPTIPSVKENQGCPIVKEEMVKKVQFDAKNIFFATGSYKLLPKSFKSLNEVAKILKEDNNLKLDIESNSDNTGKVDMNQVLSENRAKAVSEYLKTKGGVDENKPAATGFGDIKPIADSKTAKAVL